MLRGLCFYGTPNVPATPTLATIFDPILQVTVNKIPQCGKKNAVAIRGALMTYDTLGGAGEDARALIRIGQDTPIHEFAIPAIGDADSQDYLNLSPFIPMGDFLAGENDDIAIYLVAEANAGNMAGVLYYDDLEPAIDIPKGRIVSLVYPNGGADASATAYAAYGTIKNPLNTKCLYYIIGCQVMPENSVVQALGLHSSDEGLAAVAPPKGIIWYPSVPLVIDGNATVAQKALVQAAGEIDVIWYAVEVPKASAPQVGGTQVAGNLKPFLNIPVQALPVNDPRAKSGYVETMFSAIRRA